MDSQKLTFEEESNPQLYQSLDSRIFSGNQPSRSSRKNTKNELIKNPEASLNSSKNITSVNSSAVDSPILSKHPEILSEQQEPNPLKINKSQVESSRVQYLHNSRILKTSADSQISIPDENPKKVLSFIKTFLKYCSLNFTLDSEALLSRNISALKQSELKTIQGLFCVTCFRVFIPIELDCGDLFCSSCLNDLLNSFMLSPSLETFKSLACSVCHLNISTEVIRNLLADHFERFNKIQLKFVCESCNFKHPANENFWTECPCFHLCGNCYSESVYFNHPTCRVCNARFRFTHVSTNRTSRCENCDLTGLSISSGFRFLEKTLCFNCIQEMSVKAPKEHKRVLSFYLNKSCSACLQVVNIAHLAVKRCCENFVCETCFESKGCPCTGYKFTN